MIDKGAGYAVGLRHAEGIGVMGSGGAQFACCCIGTRGSI